MKSRWMIAAAMAAGASGLVVPSVAHAATTITLSNSGKLTVKLDAAGSATLSCSAGKVAVGATVSPHNCNAVKNIVVTGSVGNDVLDLTQVREAEFATLAAPTPLLATILVQGKEGDDVVRGADIPSTIKGNGGADTLKGGRSVDTIDGGAGNDTIRGGAGADAITGGGDNDTISGDVDFRIDDDSVDVSSGGAGDDTFYLTNSDRAIPFFTDVNADKVFINLTRKPKAGEATLLQIENPGGGNEPQLASIDVQIGYAGTWTFEESAVPGGTIPIVKMLESGAGGWRLTWAQAGTVKVTFSAGNDIVRVKQSKAVSYTFDGGAGADKLSVQLIERPFTNDGVKIRSANTKSLAYANIETVAAFGP
jgi:Ca2+-binding RTX toxin-like protein